MANDRMGSTAADRRPHTPYEEMVPIAVFDGVVRLRVAWPQDDPTDCEHTGIKRRSGKVVCSAVAMNDLGSPVFDGE